MQGIATIFKADNFAGDWYGWATNQISHVFVGVFLVFWLCTCYFFTFGEMPYKTAVLGVMLSGYLLFEIGVQGWRGLDTIEDTVFTVGYGAAGVLSGFTEVSQGSPLVAVNVIGLAPFFAMAVAHLVAGSAARITGRAI